MTVPDRQYNPPLTAFRVSPVAGFAPFFNVWRVNVHATFAETQTALVTIAMKGTAPLDVPASDLASTPEKALALIEQRIASMNIIHHPQTAAA